MALPLHGANLCPARALIEAYPECGLRVWLTFDGNVYDDSFLQTAVAGDGGGSFVPTLLLVVTRLGLDSINAVYWEALKAAVQMPMSLGIAGYPSPPLLRASWPR